MTDEPMRQGGGGEEYETRRAKPKPGMFHRAAGRQDLDTHVQARGSGVVFFFLLFAAIDGHIPNEAAATFPLFSAMSGLHGSRCLVCRDQRNV